MRAPDETDLETDAPPCAELLADALEALEAGERPREFAAEELVHLLERMPAVARERRRRRGLRALDEAAAKNPGSSRRFIAAIAARRTGEPADTLRRWDRERWDADAGDSPHGREDAAGRKEPS